MTITIRGVITVNFGDDDGGIRDYCIAFLIVEAFMIAVFVMLDLLLSYVFLKAC